MNPYEAAAEDVILFSYSGVTVTRYVGPDLPFSDRRERYKLTADDGALITLDAWQWDALAQFFTADCAPDCEGPRTEPIPDNWRWQPLA